MSPQAGHPVAAAGDYRRLLATLVSRATRLGSRDPEGAAQEALKRSLENTKSQSAVEYYFSEDLPAGARAPEWPLDQLFSWLHGVLYYVVREERSRVSYQREISTTAERPEESFLDDLIRKELHGIVGDCVMKLEPDYQMVLRMRFDGLKYGEIATRLGINENTVATWVSRGIRAVGECVRRKTERGAGQ